MSNKSFFKRFRWIIILCCLCGVYIPGAENLFPFKSRSLVFAYLSIFFTLGWFTFVDDLIIILTHDLPFAISFQLVTTMGMVCWVFLTSMSMLIQEKNFDDMIRLWDEELQPELFKEQRDAILKTQTNLVWRKILIFSFGQVFPLLLFFIHSIWVGQLMAPSSFGEGTKREASSLAVLPQMLSFACWLSTYPLCQCLFTLVLRLILADLEYLKFALEEVFSELTVNNDGRILQKEISDSNENWRISYEKSCKSVQIKLNYIVQHHIKVLQFSNVARKIYTSLVFVEFFTISIFASGFAYCVTDGYLDKDITIVAVSNMSLYCFMTSLHCAIGDNILKLCFGIGDAALYGNWMAYPTKIQKYVIMIVRIAYLRPILIQPFRMFPLLLNTFRKMTYLQYRVFRCLSDIRRQ